jgi:hypothetical protein
MLVPEMARALILSQKFHKNMLNLHRKCQVFLSGETYLSAMHAASDEAHASWKDDAALYIHLYPCGT